MLVLVTSWVHSGRVVTFCLVMWCFYRFFSKMCGWSNEVMDYFILFVWKNGLNLTSLSLSLCFSHRQKDRRKWMAEWPDRDMWRKWTDSHQSGWSQFLRGGPVVAGKIHGNASIFLRITRILHNDLPLVYLRSHLTLTHFINTLHLFSHLKWPGSFVYSHLLPRYLFMLRKEVSTFPL